MNMSLHVHSIQTIQIAFEYSMRKVSEMSVWKIWSWQIALDEYFQIISY